MKATSENISTTYKVRLTSYRSIRYYGGREITTFVHIVNATLIALQGGDQPYIVTLNEDVKDNKGVLQYKKGHKIAICDNDFAL